MLGVVIILIGGALYAIGAIPAQDGVRWLAAGFIPMLYAVLRDTRHGIIKVDRGEEGDVRMTATDGTPDPLPRFEDRASAYGIWHGIAYEDEPIDGFRAGFSMGTYIGFTEPELARAFQQALYSNRTNPLAVSSELNMHRGARYITHNEKFPYPRRVE